MNSIKLFFIILIFYPFIGLKAQINKEILVKKVDVKTIVIDGLMNEKAWETADSTDEFWQNFPYDTSISITKTTVKVLSDKHYLYISAMCYDVGKGDYVVTSLKRDFSYPKSDAFSVHIDPFNDKTNGFAFTVSPFGVQREGLIQGGGSQGVTTDWDNKWISETKLLTNGYSVEMAIPFKTLRYKYGDSVWHINFSRNNLKINENSTWRVVPRNMNIATLVNTGVMKWQVTPAKQKFNAALIPYVIASSSQVGSNKPKTVFNAGLDAKIVVTPSLNLDITTNPDFAQVEVDRQVVNLTRFNLFFPERRNFFIENSDLFANFGFRQIRPFFSRRIGLINGRNIPIMYGVRLSGKLNSDWRIGAMNTQTASYKNDTGGVENAQNFTVAAFQKQLFSSSNIAGIFVNRVDLFKPNTYNRVAGLDYNLQSKNGKWLGKAFWHQSFSEKNTKESFAHATWLLFTDKKILLMWNHEYVDKTYSALTGFVPRIQYSNMATGKTILQSYIRFEPEISYKFFPKSKLINNINPILYSDIYRNSDWSKNDFLLTPSVTVNFQSSSFITLGTNIRETLLQFDSDIYGNRTDTFKKGLYQYTDYSITYQSNKRKKLVYLLTGLLGQFYDGQRQTIKTDISYRIQPYMILSLISSVDNIVRTEPISGASKERTLVLVAPTVELTLSKKLFFTTFLQYNSQINNININTRIQYRFKPMSDLYIVYSNNYFDTWKNKDRGLTVKLLYWLNT